jgi:phage FluMu protein Com
MDKCPVCAEKVVNSSAFADYYYVECPRCGSFNITRTAERSFNSFIEQYPRKKQIITVISSWLYRNPEYKITSDDFDRFKMLRMPNFHKKADILLFELEGHTEHAGELVGVDMTHPSWWAICYCANQGELEELFDYLEAEERISIPAKSSSSNVEIKIAPPGWAHLEKLKESNPDSKQCFIAMSFDPSMRYVYESGIYQAITSTGYDPCRIDDKEHIGKIDDKIIAEIRRSRFIVADFTGQRAGVYFEAGFALGLGLPVIWTCKKDDIKNLHFDIRQYNCIDWDDTEDLKKRLTNRIEAVLGKGRL